MNVTFVFEPFSSLWKETENIIKRTKIMKQTKIMFMMLSAVCALTHLIIANDILSTIWLEREDGDSLY